ncbi:hypothetical protein U1Q18_006003 [Sarracenia purpurea var. burkii]
MNVGLTSGRFDKIRSIISAVEDATETGAERVHCSKNFEEINIRNRGNSVVAITLTAATRMPKNKNIEQIEGVASAALMV